MIPVVLGILVDSTRVLVQERPPHKPYAGYWEFPGGKIEANESGFVALQREWKEELAVDVTHADLAFVHEYAYPDRMVRMEVWRILHYQGTAEPQESQRLLWATGDDLDRIGVLSGNARIVDWVKELLLIKEEH